MKSGIRIFAAATLSFLLLTGCSPEGKKDSVLSYAVTDPIQDLAVLEEYTNLESADLRGYHNYEEIMAYVAAHPEVEVTYDVVICGQTVSHDVAELTLSPAGLSFEDLLANLKYLPDLNKLQLADTELTAQQIQQLREAYPGIDITYSVRIGANTYDAAVQWLDLSGLTREEIMNSLSSLSLLENVKNVELMNGSGKSPLELVDVSTLQDTLPDTFFHYIFDLFGKTVTTSDEIVEFDEVPIGNEGEERIRQALDVLDSCTYFKLDDCGIDNEIMAKIREDYPDTKVVWRVHIEPFSMLTDETMLRLTFHLTNDNIHDLKYLNDVTYLDVGHNSPLTDLSFIQYMPKLECVIISGSNVVDVSVFQHCPNLVWLEMCFCYNIEDISFLKDHKTLKYLNISFSKVSDLSALDNVALERMMSMGIRANWEERHAFEEKHPDCISVWEGKQPYGYGWRYNDYGYTFFEYYANMRIVFRYDERAYFGNHKEK